MKMDRHPQARREVPEGRIATTCIGLAACFIFCAAAAPSPKTDFLAQISAHFTAWDADHDGTLTAAELAARVADPQITGPEAAAVSALKRAVASTKSPPPPLTRDTIRALTEAPPKKNGPNFPAMFAYGLRKITQTNRALFSSGLPKLETIHQGKLGNCFCLAPLGAMVQRDPGQVAALFHPLPDGGCEIAFGKTKVRVRAPTDGEIAIISSNESDGLWVNLYELAAGEVRNAAKPEDERSAEDLDGLARGGSAGAMLAALTGHEITRSSFKFAKDAKLAPEERDAKLADLRDRLKSAVSERRLMTCGTIAPTTPGITPHHAYAMLGYTAETDLVRLWNPHGDNFRPKGPPGIEHGYARTDGIFELPLTEFVQQFSGMAFELSPAP